MKFKLMTIAVIAAISAAAYAARGPAAEPIGQKKKQPVPVLPRATPPPKPWLPTIPTVPSIDPTLPTFPDLPNIPLPGHDKEEPGVPFPMATILPFPWGNIEGIWRVEVQGAHLLFSFRVETDYQRKQYLRVIQIDHLTGQVLAEGVGISIENDRLVRAAMNAKGNAAGSYMLFVGSYKNDEGKTLHGQTARIITVLTVRSFSDLLGDKDVQVAITKLTNTPYQPQKSLPKPVLAY